MSRFNSVYDYIEQKKVYVNSNSFYDLFSFDLHPISFERKSLDKLSIYTIRMYDKMMKKIVDIVSDSNKYYDLDDLLEAELITTAEYMDLCNLYFDYEESVTERFTQINEIFLLAQLNDHVIY